MRTALRVMAIALIFAAALIGGVLAYVAGTGLRGQPRPGPLETRVARAVRGFAVPSAVRARQNPVPLSEDALGRGMNHFARYCAICHANNGSGADTPLGSGLFPKPPDMRAPLTQDLSDGELFYVIVNGVRFTGMPAFGTGTEDAAGEMLAWQLVHFVRHLPRISEDEIGLMETMNVL